MNQPALYKRSNKVQRHDAKKLINEFADIIQFRSDGRDSLMDVGCGPGDVLMDFIYPILPSTFTKVIGTDISQKMIENAKQSYAEYNKVDFKVLDIETDQMPLEFHEQFDHVTSFYCLHWAQNQRQALQNIYNMLFNDGDCLLVFPTSSPVYELYLMLSEKPEWKQYMKDIKRFISPSHNNPDPWKTYTNLFKKVGFNDYQVEIRESAFIYEGNECFRDHLMSINPFLQRMPLHKQHEFITEMCEIWKGLDLCEKMPHKDDYRYMHPTKVVLAYARK